MSAQSFEAAAATVAEATRLALEEAGLAPEQALVEVLSEGGLAVPGERLSAATAKVRVSPLPEEAVAGRRYLAELLRLMGVEATVTATRPGSAGTGIAGEEESDPVMLEVDGVDLGILIGWRGESLRALQTIVNLMVSPTTPLPGGPRIIVDVAHYRERRERTVAQMARRLAAGVARSGRAVTLDPMPPYERRAVHLALSDDPLVSTESRGVAESRSVTILPAPRDASGSGQQQPAGGRP